MADEKSIKVLAVVTKNPAVVAGGGAPVFIGRDDCECERIARSLSRILDAMAHYLDNDTFIIVSH